MQPHPIQITALPVFALLRTPIVNSAEPLSPDRPLEGRLDFEAKYCQAKSVTEHGQ